MKAIEELKTALDYKKTPLSMDYTISIKTIEQVVKDYQKLENKLNQIKEYVNKSYYEMNLNPVKFSEKLLEIVGDKK